MILRSALALTAVCRHIIWVKQRASGWGRDAIYRTLHITSHSLHINSAVCQTDKELVAMQVRARTHVPPDACVHKIFIHLCLDYKYRQGNLLEESLFRYIVHTA